MSSNWENTSKGSWWSVVMRYQNNPVRLSKKPKKQTKVVHYLSHSHVRYHTYARYPLRWRHNGRDGVSNHQPHHCLLNRVFRRRSKITSKLRVTGLVRGIQREPVNSPHKWPVTWKMSPFDDVIMYVELNWVIASLTSPSLSFPLSLSIISIPSQGLLETWRGNICFYCSKWTKIYSKQSCKLVRSM